VIVFVAPQCISLGSQQASRKYETRRTRCPLQEILLATAHDATVGRVAPCSAPDPRMLPAFWSGLFGVQRTGQGGDAMAGTNGRPQTGWAANAADNHAGPTSTSNGAAGSSVAEVDYDALLDEYMRSPEEIEAERTKQSVAAALLTQGAHDEGHAHCVFLRYAGLHSYNESFGWLAYSGTHWIREGAEAIVDRAIVETLEARIAAAASSGQTQQFGDLIKHSIPNNNRVQGTKALLKSKVYCPSSAFDADPDLLNCRNGVVDLRTGEMLPHNAGQRFTHCVRADFVPGADSSPWENWLAVAVGDALALWLQVAVGYALTGHTKEEVLFYLFGPPRSGKGIFLETLLTLLGSPLAEAVGFHLLTAPHDADTQNFQLAPLRGSRLIAASESNQYERFNEAKLKAVTGGDSIQAAFKHHTSFSFRPTFKIFLSSNQPINADPDDDAVWGRVRVVEFPCSHLGREDKSLKERMRSPSMLEGVLAWAVRGAVQWYAMGSAGLPEPESCARLKRQQRGELDHVGAWIDECCQLDSQCFTAGSALYGSYAAWCRDNGVEPKKQKAFAAALQNRDHRPDRQRVAGRQCRGFHGLRLSV